MIRATAPILLFQPLRLRSTVPFAGRIRRAGVGAVDVPIVSTVMVRWNAGTDSWTALSKPGGLPLYI